MRTIIDLPDDQLAALDVWRRAHGVSRAEAVRRAVACLLENGLPQQEVVQAAFGLWKGRDGMEEQERLRRDWDDR